MPTRDLTAAVALALVLGAASGSAQEADAPGLAPGALVVQKQTLPVRVVLIGFGDEVDAAAILEKLPRTSTPVVRYPRSYGQAGRDLALQYRFEYRVERASADLADRFFAHLAATGTEGDLTSFQRAYDDQARHVLEVSGPVLYVDGPQVEKWLLDNDPGPAGERGYTVFFINWYGRPDFRFHVYTKTDEPDPDTGYNFGLRRASRKMIAWGGTHGRSWFYDFSAGPESWGGNYDVDDRDLDGDGAADYRVPPIWEYASPGYRAPDQLGADMGRLVRFVAIDLLFATSPLYDPLATAPAPGGRKIAHVAMLEDESGASGMEWLHADTAERAWRRFQPYYAWKVAISDTSPIDAAAKQTLDVFTGNRTANDCWNRFGTTFAQLFCGFEAAHATYLPAYGRRDAVGGIFSYSTSPEGLGSSFGLLGFADDNWTSGAPTYEFIFGGSAYRALGYGFSATVIHEFGHHLGVSHPHDGYDSELDLDYGATGDTFFAWLGDESDTVMSYLSVSNGFGRHAQDNMYRWETAGYLNWSNAIAGDILTSGNEGRVAPALALADTQARRARAAFAEWRYLDAARSARAAYETVARAAESVGVSSALVVEARTLAAATGPRKEGCRPRFVKD